MCNEGLFFETVIALVSMLAVTAVVWDTIEIALGMIGKPK